MVTLTVKLDLDTYPIRPQEAERSESVTFWSLDKISRKASMFGKWGVTIEKST